MSHPAVLLASIASAMTTATNDAPRNKDLHALHREEAVASARTIAATRAYVDTGFRRAVCYPIHLGPWVTGAHIAML
jgi:hypothetical protein